MNLNAVLPPNLIRAEARDEVVLRLSQLPVDSTIRMSAARTWQHATGVELDTWERLLILFGWYRRSGANS